MWRWWCGLCLVGPAVQAVVLDPAESPERWRNVTVIDDAKVGDHAVRYEVPTTGPAGPSLSFGDLGRVPTEHDELIFWYRFNGAGACSLMIKLVAYPYADGWQATWGILPRQDVPQGWQRACIDFSSEWMKWGDKPDEKSRTVHFRTDAAADAKLTLDIDHVVLQPRRFSWSVGAAKVRGAQADVPVSITNSTAAALSFDLSAGGLRQQVTVPGGQTADATVIAPINARWLRDAKPLDTAELPVTAQVSGDPDSAKELSVTIAKPIALPDHPRLLISGAELATIRERVRTIPWVKASYDKIIAGADGWLTKPVDLPDRGGQWWHWYACKADGTRLTTVSPTEHKCNTCGKVYSGWPYDDVVLDRIHGSYAAALRDLGFAYQMTGDAKYLPKAAEILMAYADKYLTYPLHNINGDPNIGGGRVGPQTLDESTWLIPMCQGADMIWNGLTPEQQQRAELGLFRPAAEVIRQHKMSIHNIQCWKNSAVGLVGLLLDDPELVADAVNSDHGFKQQIAKGVNLDGQWYEGAWGYHFYTVSAITPLVEAAERCGLGLYAYEHDGRQFKGLFDGPLRLAMPDLVLPAFNDSGTVNLKGSSSYEVALSRYGDPQYATVLNPDKRGGLIPVINGIEPLPELPADAVTGGNFQAAGYAILQHGTGNDASWACLKYGPHGGGHGHPDKLNLLIWHRGRLLGIDPGTAAYGVPIQKEWFRTTIAHNTLTIDEANQKEASGQSLGFANGRDISVTLAGAGKIADGVSYRRGVALFGNQLLLVLDDVVADKAHTFDLAWHNAGTWASKPAGSPLTMPAKPGYMHLKDMVKASGALPVIKVDDAMAIGLAVAGGEVWAGHGFGRRAGDQVTATICRVQGTTARVGWAMGLDGTVPQVRVEGEAVVATLAGQTYRLALTGDEAAPIEASGPQGTLKGVRP